MNATDNVNVNALLKEIEQLKREITMLKSDMDVEVSVIVAVNDNLAGMKDCFDTLLMQTLHKMEIICMYAGNNERTVSTLKQYALMDSRVVLYTSEENHTNRMFADGVRFARGKYVTFFSQNCWYASDNELKTLYLAAKEQNAAACGGNVHVFGTVAEAEDDAAESGAFSYAASQTEEYLSCYLFEKEYVLGKIDTLPELSFYYNDAFAMKLLNEAPSIYKLKQAVCVHRLAGEATMDCYHRAENPDLAGEGVLNVVSDYLNAAAYIIAYAAEHELKTLYARVYLRLFTVWNAVVGMVFSSKNTELAKTIKDINDAINTQWLVDAGIAAYDNMYHVVLFETMRGEEFEVLIPADEESEKASDEAAAEEADSYEQEVNIVEIDSDAADGE